MRIYTNWLECYGEIKRDLKEMGIIVKPKSMQDKNIEGNTDYETYELQNYSYMLLCPYYDLMDGVSRTWADMEFNERVKDPFEMDSENPKFVNPGEAYKERIEVWKEFLHNGKFAYTYNERIWQNDQLMKVIDILKKDNETRQAWLSIWNPNIDPNNLGGGSRVPCSLGYNFQIRNGKLDMHYIMRSCDFSTHFCNDVYLALRLQEYVANLVGVPIGNFTHTMFSLHVYKKDVKDVF